MSWQDLHAEVLGEFCEAQSGMATRIRGIWWEAHSQYVLDKQRAKKRHSLRAMRKRLFGRAAIECKNDKCRARFVPYRGNTKYCSNRCRIRQLSLAKYHRKVAPKPARTCPVCQTTFTGRRRNAIYCGWRCTRAVARGNELARQREVREPLVRVCRQCSAPIVGRRADARFCSPRCAHAAGWARYAATHREQLNARARAAYHRSKATAP